MARAWHVGPLKTAKSLRIIGGLTTELVSAHRKLVALAPVSTDYEFGGLRRTARRSRATSATSKRRVFSPALEAVGPPTGATVRGLAFAICGTSTRRCAPPEG